MAKFYGNVGYRTEVEEPENSDIWVDKVIDRPYRGDVLREARRLSPGDGTNDDVTTSNRISIIADPFAFENFHSIVYVEYMGAKWKVPSAEVQRPRLILSLGGVYNG